MKLNNGEIRAVKYVNGSSITLDTECRKAM